jgi:hypothetical protein
MSGLKPSIQALLLCDGAMNVGGKWTLQGIFGNWHRVRDRITPEHPLRAPAFIVYLRLAGLRVNGEAKFEIEITDTQVEDGDSKGAVCGHGFSLGTLQHGGEVSIDVVEVPVVIPSATFTHPGKYDVAVYVNGELLDVRNLDVLEIGL